MKGNKLVIAVILALIVCLVLIPTCAFADGEGEGGEPATPVAEPVNQPVVLPAAPAENPVVIGDIVGADQPAVLPALPAEKPVVIGDNGEDVILPEPGNNGEGNTASGDENNSEDSNVPEEENKVDDAVQLTASAPAAVYTEPTLQDQINNAGDKEITIVLDKDYTESITIKAGQNIILDLNGKKLTNEDGKHTIWNNSTLTIIDSVGTGVVDNVSHGRASLVNYGTATITGGTITRSKETGVDYNTSGDNSYYVIDNHGSMTIEGNTKVEANGWFSSLIRNVGTANANAKLTINSGSFYNGANNVKNDDYGILAINGGTFVNEKYVTIMNWNVATINGGTFNSEAYNTVSNGYWESNGTIPGVGDLTINGGTFNSANENSGNLFGKGEGSTKDKGTITINGGNFNGTANSKGMPYDVIYNNGVFSDSNVKDLVNKDDVAVISANGKTAIASNENAESIKEIIAEAVKSGEPLVIENLPEDVSVSAPEGVTIINKSGSTLTVNGVEVKSGESYTVPKTVAPAATPLSAKYFVLEGKAQQWTDGDLEFVLNSNAVVKVLIDGVEVEFTVAEDGTVTIASAVIEALEAGTHEIEFVFADGSCSTTFTK